MFARYAVEGGHSMRHILRKIACIMATLLACTTGTLPSCAFMGGGGGMKGGMFSEGDSASTQGLSM
jgi:hypothetical protein